MAKEKKDKRVSVSALDDTMKEIHSVQVSPKKYEWRGVEISVKPFASVRDMVDIPRYVIDVLFTDEGTYVPSLKRFAVMSAFVEFFTNITLPQNIDKRFDFLYHTDIYEFVKERVDKLQCSDILDAIDEAIDYRCESELSRERGLLNDVIAQFNRMNDEMNNLMGGVSNTDVANVFKAFSTGRVSEEKLLKEYMKLRNARTDGEEKPEIPVVK